MRFLPQSLLKNLSFSILWSIKYLNIALFLICYHENIYYYELLCWPTDNQQRILYADELHHIDRHTSLLVSLLDVKKKNFLDSLVDDGCITDRHRNRIKGTIIKEDKNKELLSIIRRRSYSNFVAFIDVLKRTKQKKVAGLLEQKNW